MLVKINVDGEEQELYIDGKLFKNIQEKVLPQVQKKDNDWVWIIDGKEGTGKSVLAMQLAKILDPNFNISKIAFTAIEFRKAVLAAKKYECVVFDEAFTGLSSKQSLSETNKMLVELMMEMRQKNLFVIIVMPTFFLLERYVALFRARGLFHVYTKNGLRGRWVYFNNKRKTELYFFGKKLYSYSNPKSRFLGRFLDRYTVSEKEYRAKKASALQNKQRMTRAETFKQQRDTLLMLLNKDYNISHQKISNRLKELGVVLERKTISDSVFEREKQLQAQAQ